MTEDELQKHLDEMQHHESILWDMNINDDNDETRKNLKKIQAQLEEITKPCFEEPMKTYSIFTKKFW